MSEKFVDKSESYSAVGKKFLDQHFYIFFAVKKTLAKWGDYYCVQSMSVDRIN